jgi:hypothetical protein
MGCGGRDADQQERRGGGQGEQAGAGAGRDAVAVDQPLSDRARVDRPRGGPAGQVAGGAGGGEVLRTAVPSDAPTWFAVCTAAAATPASRRSTPLVATLKAGVDTQPMPAPSSSSAGSTPVR